MCLIAWRWLPDAPVPLVWAANRDEFAHRSTGILQHWSAQGHQVLSGLDLALEPIQTMRGTWAGVNAAGKFAWLTNIRNPQYANPEAPSRGHLVSQYLCNHDSPVEYLTKIHAKAHRYNGFNLVLGQIGNNNSNNNNDKLQRPAECLHYNSQTQQVNTLKAGVYGLSNADLDTPWPKTRALVQVVSLQAAAQHGAHLNTEALFAALNNAQRCSGDDLPSTGVPIEIEHVLSSVFIAANIRGNEYGTRSSTVGWVRNGAFEVYERSFDAQGLCNNTVSEVLHIKTN
jgi:uncharacterized protein with NRDE domain